MIFWIGMLLVGKFTLGQSLQQSFVFKLIKLREILKQKLWYRNNGGLLPPQIIYRVLKKQIWNLGPNDVVIIDCFPCSMQSVLHWGLNEFQTICMIYLFCDLQNLTFRGIERQ